jgi:hypothetical protein
VSGPRDPGAVERSLRKRAVIERVWLGLVQREPFKRHQAKDISRRLPFRLSDEAIRWHMRAIRDAAAAGAGEALPSQQSTADSPWA